MKQSLGGGQPTSSLQRTCRWPGNLVSDKLGKEDMVDRSEYMVDKEDIVDKEGLDMVDKEDTGPTIYRQDTRVGWIYKEEIKDKIQAIWGKVALESMCKLISEAIAVPEPSKCPPCHLNAPHLLLLSPHPPPFYDRLNLDNKPVGRH